MSGTKEPTRLEKLEQQVKKIDSAYKVEVKDLKDSLHNYRTEIANYKTHVEINKEKYESVIKIQDNLWYWLIGFFTIVLVINLANVFKDLFQFIRDWIKGKLTQKIEGKINETLI